MLLQNVQQFFKKKKEKKDKLEYLVMSGLEYIKQTRTEKL